MNSRTGLQQQTTWRPKLQQPERQPADSIDEGQMDRGFLRVATGRAAAARGRRLLIASAGVGASFRAETGRRANKLLPAQDRLAVQQLARTHLAADRAGPCLRVELTIRSNGLGRRLPWRQVGQKCGAAHRKPFTPPPTGDVFKTGFFIHCTLRLVIYFTLYTFLWSGVPVRNSKASDAVHSAIVSLRQPIRPWVTLESRTTKRGTSTWGRLKSNSTWLPWRTAPSTAPATANSRRTSPSSA